MNTEAIKKSELNKNKTERKSFDLIIEKDNNEYVIFPVGGQGGDGNGYPTWSDDEFNNYSEPEITLKSGGENRLVIGKEVEMFLVDVNKEGTGQLRNPNPVLYIGWANDEGFSRYELEKHPDFKNYYKVDKLKEKDLKALKEYCEEVDYKRNIINNA